MAWNAILGFLAKQFWFPAVKTHIVKPVGVPAHDCEHVCAATTDCCRWGVAAVKNWEDAGKDDVQKGFTALGWQVHGKDKTKFEEAKWCTTKKCAEGDAVPFVIKTKKVGDKWKVEVDLKGVKKHEFEVAKFPGQGDHDIYILVILSETGWALFDKAGTEIGKVNEVGALKNLEEAPANNAEVTFVKSYSCGLFKKDANVAQLRLQALESGLLKKCDGKPHESIVDGDKAFAAALKKVKAFGRWSVDASAESQGMSFASIVCAVFSSVALVFVVLFVAKRESQLEVGVADE